MKIRIKKKNRGKFTALKKRTGHSASWFKAHGTPAQKKMAVFALNARKWKHAGGGIIHRFDEGSWLSRLMPQVLALSTSQEGTSPYITEKAAAIQSGDYEGLREITNEESKLARQALVGQAAVGALTFMGPLAASGLETMGEYAMPSTFLRGLSYYAPKAAGVVSKIAPVADAGALAYWSAAGLNEAGNSWREGDKAKFVALGALSALPAAMPLGIRGTEFYRKLTSPIEAGDLSGMSKALSYGEYKGLPKQNNTSLTGTYLTAEAVPAASVAPYTIQDLGGGYMLKSLMRGNPLEKQIGKNGTVNVNNVRAVINKGSNVEKAVVDKVLASEEFAGKKAIDYNQFRKAVQDELITYERTPEGQWSNYGMDRLHVFDDTAGNNLHRIAAERFLKAHPELDYASDELGYIYEAREVPGLGKIYDKVVGDDALQRIEPDWFAKYAPSNPEQNTFTFSSSRIPHGSGKHYASNTLGHSRTYTTYDEPDVLHVMESQSDWAQSGAVKERMNYIAKAEERYPGGFEARRDKAIGNAKKDVETWKKMIETGVAGDGHKLEAWELENIRTDQLYNAERRLRELEEKYSYVDPQELYLSDNFTSRQIQENLRYAAEKGQTKMRYPTKETAAKIEGYPKETKYYDADGNIVTDSRKIYTIGKENEKELNMIQRELDGYYAEFNVEQLPNGDYVPAGKYSDNPYQQLIEAIPRKQAAYDRWRASHPNATSEKGQRIVDDMKQMAEERKNFRLRVKYLNQRMKELKSIEPYVDPSIKKEVKYMHEDDILRKYNEFPKQFKKLYKGADVRTVTDAKGNTWYEVDVPKDYLQQEWAYAEGGHLNRLARGGIIERYGKDKILSAIAKMKQS